MGRGSVISEGVWNGSVECEEGDECNNRSDGVGGSESVKCVR